MMYDFSVNNNNDDGYENKIVKANKTLKKLDTKKVINFVNF